MTGNQHVGIPNFERSRRKQNCEPHTTERTPEQTQASDVLTHEGKKGHPLIDYAATQRRLVGSKTGVVTAD
jgi:hypothetical protein